MSWITMRLRGQKVLARCDESGRPLAVGGRVEIRYNPADGRAYKALPQNLEPIAGAEIFPDAHCAPAQEPTPRAASAPAKSASPRAPSGRTSKAAAIAAGESKPREGAVVVYADGGCHGNPGPAGLGVVVDDGETRLELSEYLGHGTNNVAELTAILRVAERYAGETRPIEIRTDSQYSIGVLSKGWKAKANVELVADVKRALSRLPQVHLIYVPGHAGVAGNERADQLATRAISARHTSGWVVVKGEGAEAD